MATKKFNPAEWQPNPVSTDNGSTKKENKPNIETSTIPIDGISADIQSLVEQIEAAGIDITAGYDRWRDIGFALVEALGEDGRFESGNLHFN